jgi:hypothetical protein
MLIECIHCRPNPTLNIFRNLPKKVPIYPLFLSYRWRGVLRRHIFAHALLLRTFYIAAVVLKSNGG